MRNIRRILAEGPSHIIRWQGARLALDHVSHPKGHDAFAMNVNKGTKP